MQKCYKINEASAMLGISRATLYNLMNDGKIGSLKIRGARRITEAQIEKFLKENDFGV